MRTILSTLTYYPKTNQYNVTHFPTKIKRQHMSVTRRQDDVTEQTRKKL